MKKNWFNNKKVRKGFTLIELIIVMVIIGVLGVVAYAKYGDSTDDAQYTKEIQTIANIKSTISVENSKNRIYDILDGQVADYLKESFDKKMEGMTYFIASTVNANKSAQSLVAFGTDDASKSRLKLLTTSLEDLYDGPDGTATDGRFQYDTTCATGTTDGTDCYYMVYLDGNIPVSNTAWIPTISSTDLNADETVTTTGGALTYVKLK